jgi:UDPglucose 6-dehydrogenase
MIAVVGCGKLGLPLALLLAESGQKVMGVDANPDLLDSLKRGVPQHHEPHLAEMLAEWGPSIDWRSDVADAAVAELVFVVVPTPSLPSGAFDVSLVTSVISTAAHAVPRGHSTALCVVSTVNPGDTEGVLTQALTDAAPIGDVELVYSPEFIALGDVFAGMRRPDLILIGETDRWTGDRVVTALRMIRPGLPDDLAPGARYFGKAPQVHRLSPTDAEIAKLGLNVGLTVKLAYASTISALVAAFGGNPRQVADAIGADHRIGRAFLSPGPPPAGPCLPRDGLAFTHAATSVGLNAWMVEATRAEAVAQRNRILRRITDRTPRDEAVLLLGMTYKPGTEVADGAIGPWLADRLQDRYGVSWSDPSPFVQELVDEAYTVVPCTDDPAWRSLNYTGKVVIDLWGCAVHTDGVTYVGPS